MDDCHLSNITKLEKKKKTLNLTLENQKTRNPLSKKHAQVGFREDIKSKKDGNRC